MENTEGNQASRNLSQLMIAIQNNPELLEAFQSPSAPRLMLDVLRSDANVASNEVAPSELRGTAVKRSPAALRAVDKVFEIDLIFEMILAYCSFDSLKACRQVSKRWRDSSLKSWRKQGVLCVPHEEVVWRPDRIHFKKLTNIIETVKAGGKDTHELIKTPFASYNLDWWFEHVNDDTAGSFIEQFQRHTTFLNVKVGAYDDDMACWRIGFLLSSFPQLTHLVFSDAYLCSEFSSAVFKNVRPLESLRVLEMRDVLFPTSFPWIDFLRRLPQLQKLVLHFACSSFDKEEDETDPAKEQLKAVFRAIGSLRAGSEGVLNLTELDLLRFYGAYVRLIEKSIVALLRKCKLPLERFSCDLGRLTKPSTIRDLLAPFSASLKFLRLTRGLGGFLFGDVVIESSRRRLREMVADIQIRLEKLEELRLLNGPCWGFHQLSYLDAPMLSKLVFETDIKFFKESSYGMLRRVDRHFHKARVMYTFLRPKTFLNLVAFEFQHDWNLLESKDLQTLGAAMPNLKNLAIPLSKETFKDVCRIWPAIKSLDVRRCEGDFPEVDDEAITGFTGITMGSSLPPNVTDLKELTDLVICCERTLQRKDVKFTDHSIIHGFLKLPRLHYLSIAFKQISENAKAALESHVNYVHYQSLKNY